MEFKRIKNIKDLQKENGIYYPYIMQILGAPVINGVLICDTDLKCFYNYLIQGIAEIIITIPIFKKLDKEEFKRSMMCAIADLFCGGYDPEDVD